MVNQSSLQPCLICFDIGNVLVKLGPSFKSSSPASVRAELEVLFKCYGQGEIDSNEFFREFKRLLNWKRSLPELREYFIYQRILGLQPGVQQILKELNAQGIPLALISNTNAAHWEYLVSFPELDGCQFKVLSFEHGCTKPDEKIFRKLEELSGFAGAQILFFDDVKENVAAAKKLGWRAVRIDPRTVMADIRRNLHVCKIVG